MDDDSDGDIEPDISSAIGPNVYWRYNGIKIGRFVEYQLNCPSIMKVETDDLDFPFLWLPVSDVLIC